MNWKEIVTERFPKKTFLRVSEVAEFLRVSKRTAYTIVDERNIGTELSDRCIRVSTHDLAAYLKSINKK